MNLTPLTNESSGGDVGWDSPHYSLMRDGRHTKIAQAIKTVERNLRKAEVREKLAPLKGLKKMVFLMKEGKILFETGKIKL